MRILTTCFYYYYGDSRGIEPQYYYLVKVPEAMGHAVDFFDWPAEVKARGEAGMREAFLERVRGGGYDAIFMATYQEEFDRETLEAAGRAAPTFGFNSDDEWRWEAYSAGRAGWYTYMVTNSAEVYAREKGRVGNLLHVQWACTGFWEGAAAGVRDIPFSFAGMVYGGRKAQIARLNREAGLVAFGMGAKEVAMVYPEGLPGDLGDARWRTTLSFECINGLWKRSRISFTPLESSDGRVRQIKSRIFDMGLSGTLMLAQRVGGMERYYEEGKEFIAFETLEECVEKARYYLGHEGERRGIAEAYGRRTRGEHLWRHRFGELFRQAGI